MELNKLHISHLPFSPINHGDAIAGRNYRIRCIRIYVTCSTGGHDRNFRKNFFYRVGNSVKSVNPVTRNIRSAFIYKLPKVMLGNQLNSKIMGKYLNIAIFMDFFEQRTFNLKARNILVVQNAVFRMTTFFS